MKVKMMGKERIQISMGEFNCYKVKMEPDLGIIPLGFIGKLLFPIVRWLLPDFYWYFDEEEPYPCIKFDMPGSIRSVRNFLELTDYNNLLAKTEEGLSGPSQTASSTISKQSR